MKQLVYILFVLIISACTYSGTDNERLNRAQRLLNEDPRAAFDALNDFDITEMDDSATMARWAMLYGEAILANRLKAPTDTIIDIAIDFYQTHNDRDNLIKSCRIKSLLSSSSGEHDQLATALYLQKEREYLLYKERNQKKEYIFVGMFLLIIAISIIFWQRQRLRINELLKETLVAEASNLRTDIERYECECSGMAATIKSTLGSRFKLINELCETFYESQGTRSERNAIVEKVKSRIDDLKNDEGIFGEMVHSVNECYKGFLDSVKEKWPTIKQQDYKLCVYIACRLSNRSIALILGESMDVIYKRKSRLKARLSALGLNTNDIFQH